MTFLRILVAFIVAASAVPSCQLMPNTREPASSIAAAPPPPVSTDEYRLGIGDIISIRVYDWRAGTGAAPGDEDLRLERIRLDQSGVVSLPFGQYKANGTTVRELQSAIVGSLKGRFLREPRVWINIDEYRPFFVDGQVGRPGSYPFQPGLTVRKAVTIAGGFRERASLQKIFVVREQDTASRRYRADLNTAVGPGDTIIVEESFF